MYTKKEILSLLKNEATLLKENTRKYLNSLNSNSNQAVTFTANEEERKRLVAKYNAFSSVVAISVDRFEKHIAALSNMICKADDNKDNDSTLFLSDILDSYFELCNSISRFIIANEDNFTAKQAPFSIIRVSEQAIFLETAIDGFIKKIGE